MPNYKVSLKFVNIPDNDLLTFSATVVTLLAGNAAYPSLPVTLATLQGQQTTYSEKVVAAQDGSAVARAAREAARETLLVSFRKVAAYVQLVAGTNLEVLLSSGFVPVSTNRASVPLPAPVIINIDNSGARELRVRLASVPNAKAYELQLSTQPGVWVHAATFANSRDLVLTNLTPGTIYLVQARAIGGSEGHSDWSDPVAHMAM